MSFETDIYQTLIADSSLNSMVDLIVYHYIEEDIDSKKNYIVFNYEQTDETDTFNNRNAISNWILTVRIISPTTERRYNIANRLKEYLKEYSGENIQRFLFQREGRYVSQDDPVAYSMDIDFNIFYEN